MFSKKTGNQNARATETDLNYGQIASVYLVFGLLGLLTAWIFSWEAETIRAKPTASAALAPKTNPPVEAGEQLPALNYGMIGPFTVTGTNQVFRIRVAADVTTNSWSFVEGELLDAEKEYLLSFGQELWDETGSEDGEFWAEADEIYAMKLTVPHPGQYYLNIKTQGPIVPSQITVAISRVYGSSIPHLAFGVITLLIGLVLNEFANRSITRIAGRVLRA